MIATDCCALNTSVTAAVVDSTSVGWLAAVRCSFMILSQKVNEVTCTSEYDQIKGQPSRSLQEITSQDNRIHLSPDQGSATTTASGLSLLS